MATVNERLGRVLERETPTWGIRPVPDELRRFGAVDLGILWGDLSIGLLVLVSGALLVPALGLPMAAAAVVVGSLLGCLPLALMAYAGAREGVPGMVLFRPLLGLRGSWLPSAVNLVQLVGWTTFEFWAMARVANAVGRELLGFEAPWFWLGVVVVVCTALALAGPLFVVRRWLERFGIWVVVAVAVWITVKIVSAGDLGELWRAPGTGGLPFWLAVDLVIAMPVSWLPLVADYNRFARDPRASATGTFVSYAVGNIWFYLLGALLVLAAGSGPDVLDVGTTIAAAAGGAVVLVALLVGESDQAMANIYSGALSVQNIAPRLSQRGIAIAIGVVATAMAAGLQDDAALTFEFFLYLIGSVFVPLVAVFAAHYLVRSRGRYGQDRLFEGASPGVRVHALVPWIAGFAVFQWCVPTGPAWWTGLVERAVHGVAHLPFPLFGGALGASLPSFVAAFAVSLAVLPRPRPAT
ncbi:MAG: cytosine permease [Actinomycetota bacterium]|jgi:NCS1 family nucleobase:cation symporter-1|nr:cytosine permease [Actinomycetota bacterium]